MIAATSDGRPTIRNIGSALKVELYMQVGSNVQMSNVIFESPRARRTQITFDVKLNNTDLIRRIGHWEAKEQLRIVQYVSNFDTVPEQDMEKYLKNLLYWRVILARGERVPGDTKPLLKRFYIPARWYTMLDNIGEAHDYQRNIKFYPVYELRAEDVLSLDQMIAISEQIAYLKPEGYTCVQGIPIHMEGSIEFMAKVALAEGQALETIRGMDVHNPVYAFFAAVFKSEILGLSYHELDRMFRIEYSSMDVYSGQLNDYYRSVSANASDNKPITIPTGESV